MRRLVVTIIIAVIAGKIFAAAVVKFAENSDLTSKNFVHRLFSDKPFDDQTKLANIPSNVKISKSRVFKFSPQGLRKPVAISLPLSVNAAKNTKAEEKAKTDKAKEEADKKEAERRKERRKSLEEKTNVAAALPINPTAAYVPPALANVYPTDFAYAVPLGQNKPQTPSTNTTTVVLPPTIPTAVGRGGVSPQSNSNINSWTALLVSNPTAALMAEFEGLYKTNEINGTQYYTVLTAMVGSTNNESRNYGVQAAALYQNINSFKILADESRTESVPFIQAQATADTRVYAAPADAPILTQALTSGDPNEVAVAQQLQGLNTPSIAQN